MQNEEALHLRAGRHLVLGERAVGLLDVLLDHVIDQRMPGQLLVRAIDQVVALGPASDRGEIDVDHHRDEVAAVAVGHHFADVGEELQLVLDVFRREQRAVLELADILGAIDDFQMPGFAVEEAGVAGLHVAVRRHRLLGLGVVLEVADEHAGRLELHLAVIGDAEIDVRQRGPDRVGVDLAVGLRGDVEEGFGLAVELLQVQAERTVEREQVGPDRLAGGVGDANAGETEHVLQRAVDQDIAEPVQQPAVERHRLLVEDRLAVAPRHADEGVEHVALDEARVLHPDHHAGQHLLEGARRREEKRRPDLAEIGHRGVAALRAGHAEARDQALRVVEIMVADPGERQIGQRLVLLRQVIEGHRVGARADAALRRQHHAFGLPGGAGGVEDDRGVGALAGRDLAIEPGAERCVLRQSLAAVGDDVRHGVKPGVVVVAQAPPLVVDHGLELRQAVRHRQDLVDLLLVLDRGEAHLGMREHIGQLFRDGVGIDRHRHDAERLGRHHRGIELRPVGADDRHGVAAAEPQPMQAERIGADLVEQLRPGQRLPNAQILVTHRRPAAEVARISDQQFRKGIRLGGSMARHGFLPKAAQP